MAVTSWWSAPRDRGLLLDVPDDLRDGVLRRNIENHMDVVLHHVPLDNLAFFLRRQLVKHGAQVRPDRPVQRLSTAFRTNTT